LICRDKSNFSENIDEKFRSQEERGSREETFWSNGI